MQTVSPPKGCSICKSEEDLQPLGQIPVRTKGATGMIQMVFGDWAEMGEEIIPLDVFRCKKCGHLELFDLNHSIPAED